MSVAARQAGAPAAPAEDPAFAVVERAPGEDVIVLRLGGSWRLGATRPALRALEQELERAPARRVVLVADELRAWDSSLLTWLRAALRSAAAHGAEVDRTRLPHGIATMLRVADEVVEAQPRERPPPAPFLARVG